MRWWLFAVVVATGCLRDAQDDGHTAAEAARDDFYGDALPALQEAGCVACHGMPSHGAFDFLGGKKPYVTLTTSSMFDTYQDAVNGLLMKGVHEGPALTADQTQRVLAWLDLERDAGRWPGAQM